MKEKIQINSLIKGIMCKNQITKLLIMKGKSILYKSNKVGICTIIAIVEDNKK